MQTSFFSLRAWTLTLAAVLLGLSSAVQAAKTHAASSPRASGNVKATTNASPAQAPIPKSVFVIPSSPQQGRDPFFPLSTRLRRTVPVPVVTTQHPVVAVPLELKGISGVVGHRLAIINNRNFAEGEEGEVTTDAGRVRVRCKNIGSDSVQVLVNGVERTLRFRPGL